MNTNNINFDDVVNLLNDNLLGDYDHPYFTAPDSVHASRRPR
jgi:hypothetical protein